MLRPGSPLSAHQRDSPGSSMRSFMPPNRTCRRSGGGAEIWATGLPCPGDDHFFAVFDCTDKLWQAVLGLGNTDIHDL